MAQAGYTPISLYYSTTAAAVPLAANLAQGELAINITDGKLYYENNSGTVTLLASAGGAINPITNNGVVYINSSGQAVSGTALTFNGTQLSINSTTVSGAGLTIGNDASGSATVKASFSTGGSERGFVSMAGGTGEMRIASGYSGYGGFTTFYTEGAEQMRLTSTSLYTASGINVGIGTSSPAAKLDVTGTFNGTQAVFGNTSGRGLLIGTALNGGVNEGSSVLNARGAGNGQFLFQTDGTLRMTLNDSGNLGLGVTLSAWPAGTRAFQIGSGTSLWNPGSSTNTLLLTNAYNDGTNYIYRSSSTAAYYAQSGAQHIWYNAPSGTAGNAITFTQAMTLDASGNLGVGTTSPTRKLDVSGTPSTVGGAATGVLVSVVNTGTAYNASPTSAISLWNRFNTAGSTFPSAVLQAGKENATDGNYAGYMSFITVDSVGSPTERMRLDSAGNLGLGVTPSSWFSSITALQVGNRYGSISGGSGWSGSPNLAIATNSFVKSATGVDTYIATGLATKYLQQAGVHLWYNAPSGTADTAITFTQAMTLDASGNLLVGRTSSDGYRVAALGSTQLLSGYQLTYSAIAAGSVTLTSNGAMAFGLDGSTGGTERARIDSSGNFKLNGGYMSFGDNGYIRADISNSMAIQAGSSTSVGWQVRTSDNATTKLSMSGTGGTSLALEGATPVTGTGITFPATQAASTNANTLDDYEEGTFTPFAYGSTSAGTATYGSQVGNYTKIGNTVDFRIVLAWASHTGTGNLYVGGLPFTQNTTSSSRFAYTIVGELITYSGQLTALNSGADTNIVLFSQVSATGLVNVAMDANVTYLVITGTYNV